MTATPADQSASLQDFQELLKLVAGINEDELVNKLQSMTNQKKGRLKFGQTATVEGKRNTLTIRFTPEMQQKWHKVLSQVSENKEHTRSDLKRRASKRFSKALTKGDVILEVNSQGKRKTFASESMAKKLREGTITPESLGTKSKKYDDIKVIQTEMLAQLATVFVSALKRQLPAQATVSSTAITAIQDSKQTILLTAADVQIQMTPRNVSLKASKEMLLSKKKELEKLTEKGLEAERNVLHTKQKIRKKVLETEVKNKIEETKKQTLKAETKGDDEQRLQKRRAYTLRKSRLSRTRS